MYYSIKTMLNAAAVAIALGIASLANAQTPASQARLSLEAKPPLVKSDPRPPAESKPPGGHYPPNYHTKCWGDHLTYVFTAKIGGIANGSTEPLKVRVVLFGRAPKPGPQKENAVQFEVRKLQEVTQNVPVGASQVDIQSKPITEFKCPCKNMNVKYQTYYAELLQGKQILATDAPQKDSGVIQKLITENATNP